MTPCKIFDSNICALEHADLAKVRRQSSSSWSSPRLLRRRHCFRCCFLRTTPTLTVQTEDIARRKAAPQDSQNSSNERRGFLRKLTTTKNWRNTTLRNSWFAYTLVPAIVSSKLPNVREFFRKVAHKSNVSFEWGTFNHNTLGRLSKRCEWRTLSGGGRRHHNYKILKVLPMDVVDVRGN